MNTPLVQAAAHARELIDVLVRLDEQTPIAAELAARLEALVQEARPHAAAGEEIVLAAGHDRSGFLDRSPVTGALNPQAPPLTTVTGEGRASAKVTLGLAYQGPPGRVHGGWVATLLDHLMGTAAGTVATSWIFTRSLTVDYDHGTPLFTELDVQAWVAENDGRKMWVEGSIAAEGKIVVRARGLWLGPRE
ncbi:PaaI family thioesterase [Leucobacter sp. HY1910]